MQKRASAAILLCIFTTNLGNVAGAVPRMIQPSLNKRNSVSLHEKIHGENPFQIRNQSPEFRKDDISKVSAKVVTVPSRGGENIVSALERLKVTGYFALWYALNVVYNSK